MFFARSDWLLKVGISIASHAGVFTGARISSLREEKRAPLKTPAWEARISSAIH